MTSKSDSLFISREFLQLDLKRKSVRGAIVRIVGNGTSAAITIFSSVVLARLIFPEEFGLFVMVVAVTEFARSFMELGLGTATVQKNDISHEETSMLFWINVGIGLVLMATMIIISPAVGKFYGEPKLVTICAGLSAFFLFGALTVQHRALLERQMRFWHLAAIYVFSTVISSTLAILMAFNSWGVWSLVWRELSFQALYAAGVWIITGWLPSWPRAITNVKSSLKFGAHLSGFSILQYLVRNLDRILIGRYCGASAAGLYGRGNQLAMMPVEHVRMTITGVALSPLSSLIYDNDKFRIYYSKMISALTFVYFPLIVYVALMADNLVLILYGKPWIGSVAILRAFTIYGAVVPIYSTCQLVMIACNKSKKYLISGFVSGIMTLTGVIVSLPWGIEGVAWAYAIVGYFLLLPYMWYSFMATPLSISIVWREVRLPLLCSLASGGITFVVINYVIYGNAILMVTAAATTMIISYLTLWMVLPEGKCRLNEFRSYFSVLTR